MKKILFLLIAALSIAAGNTEAATPADCIRLALNLYSNQRARKIGDLVTIEIKESTSSKKTEDFKTSKDVKANADMPFFGEEVEQASNVFARFHNDLMKAFQRDLPIAEYKIEAASAFTGSGESNSAESLTLTFTVRVIDVLENGILVVRGDRKILIRNESVSIVFTGLVRSRDIDEENTVESTRVADAHIYYETDGEVSRGTRPGYVWRIFQFLNPF